MVQRSVAINESMVDTVQGMLCAKARRCWFLHLCRAKRKEAVRREELIWLPDDTIRQNIPLLEVLTPRN